MEMTSPGVYVTETDASAIVPSTANSTTVFAGQFVKGKIDKYTQITNVDELISFYGKPTNDNYNGWYQCYNFLQYASNLLVSRACNLNGRLAETGYQITESADGYGVQSYGNSQYGGVKANREFCAPGHTMKPGDVVIFADAGTPRDAIEFDDQSQYVRYLVCGVQDDYLIFSSDPSVAGKVMWKLDIDFNGVLEVPAFGTSKETISGVFHKNSVNALPQTFDIAVPWTADITFASNKQIKNEEDFDDKLETNRLSVFSPNQGILKFISKTPGTADAKYNVCIALPEDFASNYKASNRSSNFGDFWKRYAFEGVALDGIFEYAPLPNTAQFAVIVQDSVSGEIMESFLCSLDENEFDSYNNSMFVEKVINRQSKCLYCVVNHGVEPILYAKDSAGNVIIDKANIVSTCGRYAYDTCGVNQVAKYHGNVFSFLNATDSGVGIQADDLLTAYEVFNNKEELDIDIIIGNEIDDGISAKNLAESREDCIAFIGIPYVDGMGRTICVNQKAADATAKIVDYRTTINYNSMWCSLIGNYKRQYDRYNDVYRWLNLAGDCAGLRAATNYENDTFWAAAGLTRGQIKNVSKLAYSPNHTQRGTLYTNGVNPVVNFPGQGVVLWGQKTMLDRSSSFDRVNVRGLFNKIERALAKMSKYEVFEFNDAYTRNRIVATFKPYLSTIQANRGIQDFLVVCDTTNNTADVISRNQLIVDIYIKPTYAAEFIHLHFINAGTNDFSTLVTNSASI